MDERSDLITGVEDMGEVYKQLHYDLWDWLANNPGKEKRDWPEWEIVRKNYGYITHLCFACEYYSKQCRQCPLNENTHNGPVCKLYDTWNDTNTLYIHLELKEQLRIVNKTTSILNDLATKIYDAAIAVRDAWK